jgi:hypothetical protein
LVWLETGREDTELTEHWEVIAGGPMVGILSSATLNMWIWATS